VLTRWQDGLTTDQGLTGLGLPVYRTRHAMQRLSRWNRGSLSDADAAGVKCTRALLFSGIARPDSFEQSVKQLGVRWGQHLRFGDHHRYNDRDLRRITATAAGYEMLITTEKDAVRLPRDWDPGKPLYVLRIGIEVAGDAEKFEQMIFSVVK
jgi:tetraacyldisaccharide 4'-kinase